VDLDPDGPADLHLTDTTLLKLLLVAIGIINCPVPGVSLGVTDRIDEDLTYFIVEKDTTIVLLYLGTVVCWTLLLYYYVN